MVSAHDSRNLVLGFGVLFSGYRLSQTVRCKEDLIRPISKHLKLEHEYFLASA